LLEEIETGPPLIAALGGGAFAQEEVASLLAAWGGVTIFLDAPADELWRRCGSDVVDRPLRREEAEFRRLYEARRPRYLQASLKVDTVGRAIEQIVSEIAEGLRRNHRVSGEEK
jgi:shikimate kinase